MKISKLMLIYFVAACQSSVGNANTEPTAHDWKLIKSKDDIVVYSTQKPDYKLKHFKAQTEIPQDTDTILAALQDTEACVDWVYNCIANNMVGMSDVRQRVFHTVIKSPLWFKDRDFYLQSQVVYNPGSKSFTVQLESKPDHAPQHEDRIRVSDIEMIWQLEPVTQSITTVTYQVYIDPKLPVKTINHKMIEKSIYETMLGLTHLVENPKYAETKYSDAELEMLSEDN